MDETKKEKKVIKYQTIEKVQITMKNVSNKDKFDGNNKREA